MKKPHFYTNHAQRLAVMYNQVPFEHIHRCWLELLPPGGGKALDIGAGTGRDARALVTRGFEVIAVEPAAGMRQIGESHKDSRITWLDDRLPNLPRLTEMKAGADLILVSAVWMHLTCELDRVDAFQTLTGLLNPGGMLVISLRQGPDVEERGFAHITPDELERMAQDRQMAALVLPRRPDDYGRPEVFFDTVVIMANGLNGNRTIQSKRQGGD